MQKRKKHGYAECLKYMQMIKEGTSIHAIHMKYGINEDRFHVLWNRYQSDGRSGLFKRKNIRTDFALKKEIVLDIEENHLTLHAASLKYGACSQRISVWLQQYRTDGLAALNSTKRRGRPPGMGRQKSQISQSQSLKVSKKNWNLNSKLSKMV